MKPALVVLLMATITFTSISLAHPLLCPPFTEVYSLYVVVHEGSLKAKISMHPEGISWGLFLSHCYEGSEDYWESLLEEYLVEALGLSTYEITASYISNSEKAIVVEIKSDLASSTRYDAVTGRLTILNSIPEGEVLIQVVLRSSTGVYQPSPEPTYEHENEVGWLGNLSNPLLEREFSAYLKIPVIIRVVGLPSTLKARVFVNGEERSELAGNEVVTLYLQRGDVVSLEPSITLDNHRYILATKPQRVTKPAELVFEYSLEYRVRITANVEGVWLVVDGRKRSLPFEAWWGHGEFHKISVPKSLVLSGDEKERTSFSFQKWSDGMRDNEREVKVEGPLLLQAIYTRKVEYLVKVTSRYGRPYGEGWWPEGSFIRVGVEGGVWEDSLYVFYADEGSRYVLEGWLVDGNLVRSCEVTVRADRPKEVEAVWKAQFYIEVESKYAEVEGEGWYYAGELAVIRVSSVFVEEGDWGHRFLGWYENGELLTSSSSLSFRVRGPRVLVARWSDLVRVTVKDEKGSSIIATLRSKEGWVERGSVVTVKAIPEVIYGFPANYVACGVEVDGLRYPLSAAVKADNPIKLKVIRCPDYTPAVISGLAASVFAGMLLVYRTKAAGKLPIKIEALRRKPREFSQEPTSEFEETRIYEFEEDEFTRIYDTDVEEQ